MNEQHFDALPPVNMDQTPNSPASNQGAEAQTNQHTEQLSASPGAHPSAGLVSPVTGLPLDQPADGAASPPPKTSAAATTPPIADDIDLIEKEWVEKAKQIVDQTKHDPYLQNEEMTKMKIDYLKKRYNRDIKTGKP